MTIDPLPPKDRAACDVVCIGRACVDVLVRGLDEEHPLTAEMRLADAIQLSVGGDAANQAVILSKLEVKTRLICGLASDSAAFFIKSSILSAGVDMRAYDLGPGRATPVSIVLIGKNGERNFVTTGDWGFDDYDPPEGVFAGVKVVSLGSIFVPPFTGPASVLSVVCAAKESGATVCADVMDNPDACTLTDLKASLPYIDYLFPNQEEARALTGKLDLDEAADTFLNLGVKHAVIKLGQKGCFVKSTRERMFIPAFPVEAIDTTGAGDNFAAGWITALLDGKPLRDCCRFASGVAGIAVQNVGANSGVKNKNQVLELIAAQNQS